MKTNTDLYNIYEKSIKQGSLKSFSYIIRKDEYYYNLLKIETDFLSDNVSIQERIYCYINDLDSIPLCPYCKKPRIFSGKIKTGYHSTCGSDSCKKKGMSNGSVSRTLEEKKKAAIKGQETYFKKTGFKNCMQNPECISKRKEIFKNTIGVEHPSKLKENREKAINTIKERYGTTDMIHSDKSISTIIDKYGSIENYHKNIAKKSGTTRSNNAYNEIVKKLKIFDISIIENDYNNFNLKCNKCSTEFNISRQGINYYYRNNLRFCPKCDYKNMTFRSSIEKEVGNEINKFYNKEIQYNKYIGGVECDIIIPDEMIAIEVNGLYWHSELYKDPNYHIKKKELVENEGYNLIYIWEDDWNDLNKKEIILSRLKSKLNSSIKVFARKCKIVEYDKKNIKELKTFLNNNHLQGYVNGSKFYGLTYNDELIELIELGKSRKFISGNTDEIELLRLCTKNNYNVIGGFSKLIKYAIEKNNYSKIISYSDLDWSKLKNTSYEKIGFNLENITTPNYWWCINGHKENRLNYTKQKLITLGYDKNKTENEIMHELGYYKIYGTGNLKLSISKIWK